VTLASEIAFEILEGRLSPQWRVIDLLANKRISDLFKRSTITSAPSNQSLSRPGGPDLGTGHNVNRLKPVYFRIGREEPGGLVFELSKEAATITPRGRAKTKGVPTDISSKNTASMIVPLTAQGIDALLKTQWTEIIDTSYAIGRSNVDNASSWQPLRATEQYESWQPLLEPIDGLPTIRAQREAASVKGKNGSPTPLSAACVHIVETLWRGSHVPARNGDSCTNTSRHRHCYVVPKRGSFWRRWHAHVNYSLKRPTLWYCQNLKQASDHYSWRGADLWPLAAALQSAMARGDEVLTAIVAFKILKWGGLDGPRRNGRTRDWIIRNANSGCLIKILNEATCLVSPYNTSPLHEFDGLRYIMDSGTTKIFAAAAMDLSEKAECRQDVLIYDGRVGAAMGLLTRIILQRLGKHHVPNTLRFAWSAARRNPSSSALKFPSMHQITQQTRAELTRTGAQCIQQAFSQSFPSASFIDAEKALFMVGYDVQSTCSGKLRFAW
jgi:hypothetical protein